MNKLQLLSALTLAGSLCGVAMAHGDDHSAATALPTADAITVTRDADTGKLRAATPAEMAELLRAQQATVRGATAGQRRAPSQTMLARRHAGGAVSVRMTNEMISYAVVQRQADGSLAHQCLDSEDQAQAALHPQAHQRSSAAAPALQTE